MISSSQRPLPDNTQHSQQTNIHAPGGIRTHDLRRRAAAYLRLRPHGYWDRHILQVGECEIRIHDSEESKRSIYLAILTIIWLNVSKQRLTGTMWLRKRHTLRNYTPLDGKAVLRLLRKPNTHHRINKSLGPLSVDKFNPDYTFTPYFYETSRTQWSPNWFLPFGFRLKHSTYLPHLHARCASRPSHPPNHPNISSDSKHHGASHYITFFVFTLLLVSHVQMFFSPMSLNCQTLLIKCFR